jgi:hypothetical protein
MTLRPRGTRVIEWKGVGVLRCDVWYSSDSSEEALPAPYKHTWRVAGGTRQDWLSQAEALWESKLQIAE